ncbi:MAG: type 4a pilus biogenesis protein PilO [Deltaproteobacteria bacterium]|nr:type 4a pilus biogenesis protein PilO [Deltaproteobacteria bacterium]
MAIELKKLEAVFKLPLGKRLLLLAVVWLIVVGLYYSLLYSPKAAEVRELKTRLDEIQKKVDDSRNVAKDLPIFEKEKEGLDSQFKQALTLLPDTEEIPNLLESIGTAGKTSGLEILVFKPGARVPKGFYAEIPVEMKVEGRYDSLVLFFEKVSQMPRIVNLSGVSIGGVKEVKGESILSADFRAITFMFIEEPEKPGTKPEVKK